MNPLHPLNLHTTGVSNGARCHRHLERGCMPLWETDRNRSHDALSREISHRNAARTIRGGDFSTLWRLCIESPSQPKLASSLHNKRLSYWRLTGCGRNDGGKGSVSFMACDCRSLHPLLLFAYYLIEGPSFLHSSFSIDQFL